MPRLRFRWGEGERTYDVYWRSPVFEENFHSEYGTISWNSGSNARKIQQRERIFPWKCIIGPEQHKWLTIYNRPIEIGNLGRKRLQHASMGRWTSITDVPKESIHLQVCKLEPKWQDFRHWRERDARGTCNRLQARTRHAAKVREE